MLCSDGPAACRPPSVELQFLLKKKGKASSEASNEGMKSLFIIDYPMGHGSTYLTSMHGILSKSFGSVFCSLDSILTRHHLFFPT